MSKLEREEWGTFREGGMPPIEEICATVAEDCPEDDIQKMIAAIGFPQTCMAYRNTTFGRSEIDATPDEVLRFLGQIRKKDPKTYDRDLARAVAWKLKR